MQEPNNDGKQKPAAQAGQQGEQQLSDTWRDLLGLQAAGEAKEAPQTDPASQVQPLASDPWNHLQHAQGMQPVDLQKIRLHDLHAAAHDDDIEHALDLMREAANGQPGSQEKKTGEA